MATATRASTLWPANDNRSNMYQANMLEMQADFDKEQERLFLPDDEVDITIIDIMDGAVPLKRAFKSTEDVMVYVREPQKPNLTTIIQIPQSFSWGELEISKTATQALFSHFNISPGFWPVLKLFGCKESSEDESIGGFNEEVIYDNDDSFELSYTAKHVEEHGKPEAYDPWSIRQIGVHYRYNAALNQNVVVLLNPCASLKRRIDSLGPSTEMLDIHRLILCIVTERWSQYLAYLESVCKDVSKKAILSNSPQQHEKRGFDVRFSDSQRIQNLKDTIIRVSHMLDLNLSIFNKILASSHLFKDIKPAQGAINGAKLALSSISTLSAQTEARKCHAENLLRRLDGSSVLVQSILDAQGLEASTELAMLAREDAKKATRDARTLNTITILGFVYLPASFVATLLGTQYITIRTDEQGGDVTVKFARELWIFFILTISLLLVTAAGWLLWERRSQIADRAAANKSKNIV